MSGQAPSQSNDELEAGVCVMIHGLKSAAHLNGTFGTLVKFHKKGPSAGRWGVRCDGEGEDYNEEPEPKIIAAKPENLAIPANDQVTSTPPPNAAASTPGTTVLAPLIDRWNITDTSKASAKMIKECRQIAVNADSVAQAEREIYVHLNQDNAGYESMAFPTLFPFGRGLYGEKRPMEVRLEGYVKHLLFQSSGVFMKHDTWLLFMANRIALLRTITKRPPMFRMKKGDNDEETALSPRELDALDLMSKLDEQKAFCYRYMVGDKKAADLAVFYMMDYQKSQQGNDSTGK